MNNDSFFLKSAVVLLALVGYYTWGVPWLLASNHVWMQIFATITLLIPALVTAVLFIVHLYFKNK